jgi:hypothetical protein
MYQYALNIHICQVKNFGSKITPGIKCGFLLSPLMPLICLINDGFEWTFVDNREINFLFQNRLRIQTRLGASAILIKGT